MSWNKVFDLVLNLKRDYERKFKIDHYNIKIWANELNDKRYIDFLSCLELTIESELVMLRYGLSSVHEDLWLNKDSLYKECRSLVIDLKNEELVITPFKKFFNLNETEENKIDLVLKQIENAKILEFTDKLDGSMQCARYYNNNIIFTGSRSLNKETSWRLKDGYSMLTENHKKMIKENDKLTFIFEYISIRDSHVVKYNKSDEGLYLIGIRNVDTGEEYSYSEISKFSKKYNIKMAQIEDIKLDEILEKCKTLKSNEKEGWILNIDGKKIKIKVDDYVYIHKILDKLSSINLVIRCISNGKFDDLIAKIPDIYRDEILNTSKIIYRYIDKINKDANYYFSKAPKDKIKFYKYVYNDVPKEVSRHVIKLYNNEPIKPLVLKFDNQYVLFKDIVGYLEKENKDE